MVIRLVTVSDQMPLHEFHDVFRTILGWNGNLGYIVRVHGQEISMEIPQENTMENSGKQNPEVGFKSPPSRDAIL
jgi:hypothetical protein